MDPRLLAVAVVLAGSAGFAPTPVTEPGMSISVEVRSPTIGSLTVTPPVGTDTTSLAVVSSAGCAAPSDRFSVQLFGPGAFIGGVSVLAPTSGGFSTTSPITATLGRTLADAAAALDTVLVVGTYRLALVCLDRASNKASGMFVGLLFVTSPTTYQTTQPPPPTTTPSPTPAAPPPSPGGLSYTGTAVATMIFAGLLLLGGGVAFLLLSRRRVLKEERS